MAIENSNTKGLNAVRAAAAKAKKTEVDAQYYVASPDQSITIPMPTKEDVKWAKKVKRDYKEKKREYNDSRRYYIEVSHYRDVYRRALKNAAKNGNLWRIQYGINHFKGDFEHNLLTYLKHAAEEQHADAVSLLLSNGADARKFIEKTTYSDKARSFVSKLHHKGLELWTHFGGMNIGKTSYEVHNDDTYTRRTTFNFAAHSISRSVKIGNEHFVEPTEWFHDQPTDTEIMAAYNALSAKGVALKPIETYTSRGFVRDKGTPSALRPKLTVKKIGSEA